jgi:hypothetical protein
LVIFEVGSHFMLVPDGPNLPICASLYSWDYRHVPPYPAIG